MSSFNNIQLGLGVLKIDGVNVGFLKGKVEYTFSYDTVSFEEGEPLCEKVRLITKQKAELTADFAEFSKENMSEILGGISIQSLPTSYRLNLGASTTIDTVKLEFTYTSPQTGKDITIVMWQAQAEGVLKLSFDEENFGILTPRFIGIADYDSHPTCPFGYIDFEK